MSGIGLSASACEMGQIVYGLTVGFVVSDGSLCPQRRRCQVSGCLPQPVRWDRWSKV